LSDRPKYWEWEEIRGGSLVLDTNAQEPPKFGNQLAQSSLQVLFGNIREINNTDNVFHVVVLQRSETIGPMRFHFITKRKERKGKISNAGVDFSFLVLGSKFLSWPLMKFQHISKENRLQLITKAWSNILMATRRKLKL